MRPRWRLGWSLNVRQVLTWEKQFLSPRRGSNPQPSCRTCAFHLSLGSSMVRASHRSYDGCRLDPRLRVRNCFSEVRAWRMFIYHSKYLHAPTIPTYLSQDEGTVLLMKVVKYLSIVFGRQNQGNHQNTRRIKKTWNLRLVHQVQQNVCLLKSLIFHIANCSQHSASLLFTQFNPVLPLQHKNAST